MINFEHIRFKEKVMIGNRSVAAITTRTDEPGVNTIKADLLQADGEWLMTRLQIEGSYVVGIPVCNIASGVVSMQKMRDSSFDEVVEAFDNPEAPKETNSEVIKPDVPKRNPPAKRRKPVRRNI